MVPTVPPSSSSTQEGQGEEEEAQARRPAVSVRGASSTADARAFLRRAQTHTTFRAHRQHARLECRHLRHGLPWRWSSSGRAARDRSDDDDAGKQDCQCHSLPPSYFILLLLPYMVPWWDCCESVCAWFTLANDTFFFFPDTGCPLACRYRYTAKVPISGFAPQTPARSVLQNAHTFLSMVFSRSRTCASPDLSRFQCGIHPDRVSHRSCRCAVVVFC